MLCILQFFFGGGYKYVRWPFSPILNLIQSFTHLEINYLADIGPGLLIHHCTMGVVINGCCKIGKNLTLTGGNVIGITRKAKQGDFLIGDNVNLGANACIIGPVKLGDNIKIGALACVVRDAPSNVTLVGVPAHVNAATHKS